MTLTANMGLNRVLSVASSMAVVAATITFASHASAEVCSPASAVVGSDRILIFTATSPCTWQVPTGVTALRILLVGGGGGGGHDSGSGGGGGGKEEVTSFSVTGGDELTITAGSGGSGGIYVGGVAATAGVASTVERAAPSAYLASASGGGAGSTGFNVAGGTAGEPSSTVGAGGSSPIGIGFEGTTGEDGLDSNITGSVVFYGGGGGGGIYIANPPTPPPLGPTAGGNGGGGSGASLNGVSVTFASAGTNGLGGGGGGGSAGEFKQSNGGNGGSGVVIIRYEVDPNIATNVEINAGNNQSANAGTTVTTPASVVVRNGLGDELSGAMVVFAVASGGGSLASSGSVTSGEGGIATAPAWTLGSSPGVNTLTATITGAAESPLIFTATAVSVPTPNPPAPVPVAPAPATIVAPASNPWPDSAQDATPFPPATMLSALQRAPGDAVVMTASGPQPQSLTPAPFGGIRVVVGDGEVELPGVGYVNGSAVIPQSGNLSTVVSALEPGRLVTSYLLESSLTTATRAKRSNSATFPAQLAATFANEQGRAELQAALPTGVEPGFYVLQINMVSRSLGLISLGIPVTVTTANGAMIAEHTFFERRSATLTAAGKARLTQLRREFPAGTSGATISIVGVSLGESSKTANRALATKRTMVLQQHLNALGISGQVKISTIMTNRIGEVRVARSSKGRPLSTVSIIY